MSKALLAGIMAMLASATTAQVAPAAMTQAAVKSNDVTVCKRIEPTGSRLGGKRVCQTRGEWERDARAAREQLGRAIDVGNASQPKGN